MKVIQLRRLLRTLPPDLAVLLEDLEGVSGAHEDDFRQLELSGQWGPKALVIGPYMLPLRRHQPFKRVEKSRPIERLRAHRRWVASKPQRDAWSAFTLGHADLGGDRLKAEHRRDEHIGQIAPENTRPLRRE